MISVIQMSALPDDVSIDTCAEFSEDITLLDLYNYVKQSALAIVQGNDEKMIVDMGSQEEGLPHASIYVEDRIMHQVFATYKN